MTVGKPVKTSAHRWSIPYDVNDMAGNAATTVWRDVVVEEVDLVVAEAKIREEVLQNQKIAIQKAVDKALEEDRRKRDSVPGSPRDRKTLQGCPDCPTCDCSGKSDESKCLAVCDARTKECAIDNESFVVRTMIWLERMFPPTMVPIVLACAVVALTFLMLRWTLTLIFNPQAYRRGYYDDEAERERAMLKAVVYHNDGGGGDGGGCGELSSALPPGASFPIGNGNGYFSSQHVAPFGSPPPPPAHRQPVGEDINDIYQSPRDSIISPSKRGDGVRFRSPPYSANSRSSM